MQYWSITHTAVFRLVVQKLQRESVHARTFGGDFELKFCACANSRHNFWTTNLKTAVLTNQVTMSHTAWANDHECPTKCYATL